MQGFITIKEASELTGKHSDTIRRLAKDTNNPKLVAKDRKGRVIINSEWLVSNFEPTEAPTSPDNQPDDKQPKQHSNSTLEPVINALTSQLEAKDQQIAKLQSLLSEKEGNTTKLQDQFQQLLGMQQLPANTNDNIQPAYAKPMQTEVKKTKAKPKTKKTGLQTKPKPKTKKATKQTTKQVKKRWWRK